MSPEEAAASRRVADEHYVAAIDAYELAIVCVKIVFLPEPIDVATPVSLQLGEHLTERDVANADGLLALPAEPCCGSFGQLDESHTPDAVTVSGPLSLDDFRRMFPGV